METIYDGDTVELNGRSYKVTFEPDCDMLPPWKEWDGCGIISEWERRDKSAGERILYEERGSKLFYDWQATMQKAKHEGWGLSSEKLAALERKLGRAPTKGEIIAQSVELDFQNMRDYCTGEWGYYVICVEDEDGETNYLGGVTNSGDDLSETAYQMIDEMDHAYRVAHRFNDAMACGV